MYWACVSKLDTAIELSRCSWQPTQLQQMYVTIDSEVRAFIDAFRAEAERLWHMERMAPSVLTMAAAQFLGFGYLVQGRDHIVLAYLSEATRTGTQLGLFGKIPEVSQSPASKLAARGVRATAYSAWGTFNWIMYVQEPSAQAFMPC